MFINHKQKRISDTLDFELRADLTACSIVMKVQCTYEMFPSLIMRKD